MITRTALESSAPKRFKMSYEEYLDFAGDARLVEWVGGEALIYMPPIYEHQNLVTFLDRILGAFIAYFDLGFLVVAPFEVRLWPGGPAREPDLFFAANEQRANLTSRRFKGGPDLVIEVISPGSVVEDRIRKFGEYEQAGVREYWLIDPRPHQEQVDFYFLDENGRFTEAAVDDDGVFHSRVLPHLRLPLSWLRPAQQPDPQLALAEIMLAIETLPADARDAYQALHALLSKNRGS